MIGHDIDAALPRLRAEAESRMTSAGTLSYPGAPTTDPDTGATVSTWVDYYTGPCTVQRINAQDRPQPVTGQSVLLTYVTGKVPVSVSGLIPGDRLVLSACDDPDLIGRPMFVVDVDSAAQMVQRRFTLSIARGRR